MMTLYDEMRAQEKAQWITHSHTLHQETDPQTFITFVAQGWEEGLTSLRLSSPSQEPLTLSEGGSPSQAKTVSEGGTEKVQAVEEEQTPFHRYVTQLYETRLTVLTQPIRGVMTHLTGVMTQGVSSACPSPSKVSLGLREEGEDRFDLHPLHLQTFKGCLGGSLVWMPLSIYHQTHVGPSLTLPSRPSLSVSFPMYTPSREGMKSKDLQVEFFLKRAMNALGSSSTPSFHRIHKGKGGMFNAGGRKEGEGDGYETRMMLYGLDRLGGHRCPLEPGWSEPTHSGGFFYHAYSQSLGLTHTPTLTRLTQSGMLPVKETSVSGQGDTSLLYSQMYLKAYHPYQDTPYHETTPYEAFPAYPDGMTPPSLYASSIF